jgi:hypothetical protein
VADQFCPNCGTEVDADARFCPSCGTTLGASSGDEAQIPPAPAWPPPDEPAADEPSADEPSAADPAAAEPPASGAMFAQPASDQATRPVAATTPWSGAVSAREPVEMADHLAEPVAPPPPAAPPPPPPVQPAAAAPVPGGAGTSADMPFTWPTTLSGWLIGTGSLVGALVLIPRLAGAGYMLSLLLFLALLGIAATIFLADHVPHVPHLRLIVLCTAMVGLGVALARAAFDIRGIDTLFLVTMLAAAGGALLVELDWDRPFPPPGRPEA